MWTKKEKRAKGYTNVLEVHIKLFDATNVSERGRMSSSIIMKSRRSVYHEVKKECLVEGGQQGTMMLPSTKGSR
jgi:hypothetical protein